MLGFGPLGAAPIGAVGPEAASTGGAVSGSYSIVEAADTSAATAAVRVQATASITEAADSGAATGALIGTGRLTTTEAADTSVATAIVVARGTASSVDSADIAFSTGIVTAALVHGTVAAVEAPDTSTATGSATIQGTAATSEAADIVVASAIARISGSLDAIEAADTSAATGGAVAKAVLDVTDAPDSVDFRGGFFRFLRLGVAEEGYEVTFSAQVRRDPLDGGKSRFRRDLLAANPTADVRWITDEDGYDYLQAFYRVAADDGASAVQVRIAVDRGVVEEYWVKFVPGSLALTGISGDAYSVTAQLEVLSAPTDLATDDAIVLSFELYGEDGLDLYLALAELVNVTIPTAWAA